MPREIDNNLRVTHQVNHNTDPFNPVLKENIYGSSQTCITSIQRLTTIINVTSRHISTKEYENPNSVQIETKKL